MSLDSTRELAENKVILLYFIDKMNISISSLQLTKLILENKFMNYFFLQQYLNELCEGHFLTSSLVEGKTYYSLTRSGKQALEFFSNIIPISIKSRIDNTITEIRKNVRNETLITADFMPESENEFIVSCKVHEDNFSLIDLKVMVGTRSDARAICDHWKKHSQKIYAEIIESLTKDRG